jgi:hypothetical protein
MAGIKDRDGHGEIARAALFTLAQSLDSILDNTNIDPQDVEINFDDQGMTAEFASKSFSNQAS